MIKSTVSLELDIYKMLPDLAMCSDGSLVCTYRESLLHGRWPFTRIVCQISRDGGRNWGQKAVVAEISNSDKGGGWNTPRLLHLGGQRLLMVCDWGPPREQEYTPNSKTYSWHSEDGGESWGAPADTGVKGRICPTLFETKSGVILLGADGWDGSVWSVDLWKSTDQGASWVGPVNVSSSPDLWLNECTFVQLDDSTLICYMREDKERRCAYKSISKDDGQTWEGPYPTNLLACIGRPSGRILRSGEVVIFYGMGWAPRLLVLHAESQTSAADPACVENAKGAIAADYRRFIVDHDRSIHPDGAYSGWVQLPNGDLYVVQYIVDDAPMGQIRSYRISREDWILCPEGEIISIDTSRYKEALYHELALTASAARFSEGRPRHETRSGPAGSS